MCDLVLMHKMKFITINIVRTCLSLALQTYSISSSNADVKFITYAVLLQEILSVSSLALLTYSVSCSIAVVTERVLPSDLECS